MLTSSSHQHEGFVNFTPARGLRQFHTGMRASPICVQRLADSVRSRLMCCHGMWKHVDAGSCPDILSDILSESWAHHASDGSCQTLWEGPAAKGRCNTVWEVTPRSRARTCQRPRSSVRSVCVCVWSLHPGRRARSLTGADRGALSSLRAGPRSLQDVSGLPILANDDQVQDVLRPRPRPPSQYR